MTTAQQLQTIRRGVVVGAAGGLAEIAWVSLYADTTGGNAAVLASGHSTSSSCCRSSARMLSTWSLML